MEIQTRHACLLLLFLLPIGAIHAETELFKFDGTPSLKDVQADQGAVIGIVPGSGPPAIKVDLPASAGYPGVTFRAPGEGWNLSDYGGVQVDLSNPGDKVADITMRIETKGGTDPSSWSVEVFHILPGKTETLKVRFGQSFGGQCGPVDKAHITAVRFYPTPPKEPFSVLLKNLKAYKSDSIPAPSGVAEKTELVAVEPVPPALPVFPPTPLLDLSGRNDFPEVSALNDDAAMQLKGLGSLAEFRALPEADRHVYSFDPWPDAKDDLQQPSYSFNFLLGTKGVTNQKVAFIPSGGGEGSTHTLIRSKDPTSLRASLTGFGNLGWNGNSEHVFKFNKPVIAFGVVLKSTGDMELRRFFWEAAHDLNSFPVSYTLADGTTTQLGKRELRGALIKAGTNAFIGVIDRSGTGIVSVSYMVKGLAGNTGQSIEVCQLAFATQPKPAVAAVIDLKSSCDFESPEEIITAPANTISGLTTLDDFRFIVGNHRHVYRFDTWPQKSPEIGSGTAGFSFDLKGKGTVGQKVTIKASNTTGDAILTQTTLKNSESLPYSVLGGFGDIGQGAWAEQTFIFEKPVWSFGVTYRSPNEVNLAMMGTKRDFPVSYTLSDGTVVNLGSSGVSGGILAANRKTFVGVVDDTDKGISSVTLRVQGSVGSQPVYIEDLAFAMSGPPPGDWKLTLNENFDGDQLNPELWTTGYTFKEVINNELQGYVPENVIVKNGICTIKTEVKDCHNTDRLGRTGPARKFASGAFTSYDKFTQTYGYFEARVKMPKAPAAGIWPAFWSLPDRGKNYPENIRSSYLTESHGTGVEIDVFEFQPWWKRADSTFPMHMGCIWSYAPVSDKDPAPHGYGGYSMDNDGWGPASLYLREVDTKFHTYGLYWSPERLIFYVDSKPVFRVKDPKHVPDVPQYFLFNVAMTGNGWGMGPGKRDPSLARITADMPSQMEIDYFRAYSGILDEVIPALPSDIPGPLTRYSPPAMDANIVPEPAPNTAPVPVTIPAIDVPAAPANQGISSPSNG